MATIEEIQQKILERQDKRAEELKRLQQVKQEMDIPFFKRIQLEHNIDMLKRVEAQQLEAMKLTLKRHHPELLIYADEFFYEFWTLFLAGECKSIRNYLYGVDFQDNAKRNLRKEILVWRGEDEQKD